MLDLIRANALSSHQMMSASKGALRLPAAEMVEILVYMAEHNKIFGANARFTLAAWDEVSARAIVADSSTPREVLDYWLDPRNLRSVLFPLLLENESVPLIVCRERSLATNVIRILRLLGEIGAVIESFGERVAAGEFDLICEPAIQGNGDTVIIWDRRRAPPSGRPSPTRHRPGRKFDRC